MSDDDDNHRVSFSSESRAASTMIVSAACSEGASPLILIMLGARCVPKDVWDGGQNYRRSGDGSPQRGPGAEPR